MHSRTLLSNTALEELNLLFLEILKSALQCIEIAGCKIFHRQSLASYSAMTDILDAQSVTLFYEVIHSKSRPDDFRDVWVLSRVKGYVLQLSFHYKLQLFRCA